MSAEFPAHLTEKDVSILSEALVDDELPHSFLRKDQGFPWILEWYYDAAPEMGTMDTNMRIVAVANDLDIPDAIEWAVEAVPEINWLEHSYHQFQPFSVGPFFIYGSHYDGGVPDGQTGLQIDAATAFGSGEHGTTKGCLESMLDLNGRGVCPWNVLDMGCGSGILGLAAWKLWQAPVLAVDNDPESIAVTQRHAQANGVPIDVPGQGGNLSVLVNEGFAGSVVQDKGPYELIIANILPVVLRPMAVDVVANLDENGYVILSGILHEQAQSVIDACEAQGLVLKNTIQIGEWSTLVLHNAAA